MLMSLGVALAAALTFSTDLPAPDELDPSDREATPAVEKSTTQNEGSSTAEEAQSPAADRAIEGSKPTTRIGALSDTHAEERLRAFYAEALRMEPVAGSTRVVEGAPGFALLPIHEAVAFRVWTPDGHPLERAQALRRVSADELAERQESFYALSAFETPLLVAALGLMTVLGTSTVLFSAIVLGLALVPPSGLVITAIACAGALLTFAPILAFTVLRFLPALVAVGDEETRLAIRDHNQKVADKVGLPRDGIPFPYLGY